MRAKPTQWLVAIWMSWVGMLSGTSAAMGLEIGERAPDFSLPSTTGQQISLSQFRGKQRVLLEFYGSDFAPTCGANLSARKVEYSKFQALNVHPCDQQAILRRGRLRNRPASVPAVSDFRDEGDQAVRWPVLNATYARFGIAERAFF